MMIQTSRQSHLMTVPAGRAIRRRRQVSVDFSHIFGETVFWKRVGKTVGVVVLVLLATNLVLGSLASSLDDSIVYEQNKHQKLEDRNISLLAEKARVWAPHNVERMAGKRLSLHKAKSGQVALL